MSAAIYTYSAQPNRASLERQRQACVVAATSMGLDVGETFEDQAGDRSAMARLREEVAAGVVTTVMVWHVDRLGRRISTVSTFLADMAAAGVQVRTVQGDVLDANSATGLNNTMLLLALSTFSAPRRRQVIANRPGRDIEPRSDPRQ